MVPNQLTDIDQFSSCFGTKVPFHDAIEKDKSLGKVVKKLELNWQISRFTPLDSPAPATAKQESNGVYPVKSLRYQCKILNI